MNSYKGAKWRPFLPFFVCVVMRLYIRHKVGWVNFVANVAELRMFEEGYFPGNKVIIGDLALFNRAMRMKLLKLLEENPLIDCYSSEDVSDPVLLSRFTEVIKEPLLLKREISEDLYFQSSRDYSSVEQYLDLSYERKLLAFRRTKFQLTLINNL